MQCRIAGRLENGKKCRSEYVGSFARSYTKPRRTKSLTVWFAVHHTSAVSSRNLVYKRVLQQLNYQLKILIQC